MKSLEELHEIRERMQGIVGLRAENADQILVTVGVSESGKAAGGRKSSDNAFRCGSGTESDT